MVVLRAALWADLSVVSMDEWKDIVMVVRMVALWVEQTVA
jgi:hypothetical protein